MGGAFSKKVGDRNNVEYGGQNPFSTQGQGQAQVPQATPYEDDRYGEKEKIPTGRVINETSTTTTSGGWGTQATVTTTPPPTQTSSGWGSTVQNTNNANANGSTTTAWSGAWGSGGGANNSVQGNPAAGGFLLMLFLFLIVGVPLLTSFDFFGDSSYSPPTSSPTEQLLLGDVELCPTAQFFGGQNKLTAGCDTDGCSGSVRWCGLNDAITYRVEAGVRGDLNTGASETVTISVTGGGSPTVASTVSQCGNSYEAKVDEVVSSSSGEITLSFSSAAGVNNLCYGAISVLLEITLTEIP